jgi:hypothetical protein
MSKNQRWLVSGTGTFLAAAVLILGGCAAEGPVKPAGLEQKIEAARTRADHQEIAAVYEQQAEGDRAAAERHRGLARAYERGYIAGGSRVRGSSTARRENKSFAAHCENLTRIYQQAAEENLALAREHRRLAAEASDKERTPNPGGRHDEKPHGPQKPAAKKDGAKGQAVAPTS